MAETRILIVDDDVELCELLESYLTKEGYSVESVHGAEAGLERAASGEHALVVLDVMLPGMSGFEVLRRLRQRSSVAVLMLTARGEEVDRIVGLEMGADDYLPKPFNHRELVARIRAIQRRTSPDQNGKASSSFPARLEVGDVSLVPVTRDVWQGRTPIPLTSVEFSILELLLQSAGQIVSREHLSLRALGRELTFDDRSLDVHISNLRRKLGGEAGGVSRIRTIRNVGYLYSLAEDEAGGTKARG